MKINFKSLMFNVLVPLMLSFIIAMLVPFEDGFYESLDLPFKLPPYVFTIVWSVLYVLMGLSAYIIENSESFFSKNTLKLYYLQLALNLAYMPVFFYLQNVIAGAVITVVLLILVIALTVKAYRINKLAGYLLVPYIIWLVVANYLQLSLLF